MDNFDFIPDLYTKSVLILGCGNILFGDDGFGPAVIKYLEERFEIPDNISVLDTGTGVREILFNIVLGENKPQKIIIIDAVDANREPGEVFEIQPEDIPLNKIDDFSLHQLPTSNLLRDLQEMAKVEITVIACQVKVIPDEVSIGLSTPVSNSVQKASELIALKVGLNDLPN